MRNHIDVVIVDHHPLIRYGLTTVLSPYDDIEVVGQCATAAEAVEAVVTMKPDVILLDMQLGDEQGMQVARTLRERGSDVTILLLSTRSESRRLREAMAAGADGYLVKTAPPVDLVRGIRAAVAGDKVIDHHVELVVHALRKDLVV